MSSWWGGSAAVERGGGLQSSAAWGLFTSVVLRFYRTITCSFPWTQLRAVEHGRLHSDTDMNIVYSAVDCIINLGGGGGGAAFINYHSLELISFSSEVSWCRRSTRSVVAREKRVTPQNPEEHKRGNEKTDLCDNFQDLLTVLRFGQC